MLARIVNSYLEFGVPRVGTLKDGRSVSGYDLLPADILEAEGWKNATEHHPEGQAGEEETLDRYVDTGEVIEIFFTVGGGA